MAKHPAWLHALLGDDDLDAVVAAIRRAETGTSGEVRVHLERRLPRSSRDDALGRAREVFARLGMDRTAARNGVLIYLALVEHRLAVVGDEAVHARVGDGYWTRLRDALVDRLRAGHAREAIVAAVEDVGEVLHQHFPRRRDDVNELSDDVSAG
ncbi:MAG: TPM domain-containing protein [Candidatus Rokuibacteriota bacterium]